MAAWKIPYWPLGLHQCLDHRPMGIPNLHRQEANEQGKELYDAYKALIVGAVYIGAVSINQYVIITILGSLQASLEYVGLHAVAVVFATSLTHLLGVAATTILIFSAGDGTLRRALHRPRMPLLLAMVLATVISSLVLNVTGVWPFAWRWEFDSNVALVQALMAGRHFIALVYWLALYGLGVPILEEVVFRFGILRIVRNWTGSDIAAVATSALLFGVIHLGYPPWNPDLAHLWNATGAMLLGAILGIVVLRQQGRLSGAIVIHSTFNLVSEVMLLVAAG